MIIVRLIVIQAQVDTVLIVLLVRIRHSTQRITLAANTGVGSRFATNTHRIELGGWSREDVRHGIQLIQALNRKFVFSASTFNLNEKSSILITCLT